MLNLKMTLTGGAKGTLAAKNGNVLRDTRNLPAYYCHSTIRSQLYYTRWFMWLVLLTP